MSHEHGTKLNTVTILRIDGTPWRLQRVKHVIFKPTVVALYIGEHGKDRRVLFVPMGIIDHIEVIEEG